MSTGQRGPVATTALVLLASTVLTACSGSHDSSGGDFAAAVRAVCTKYAAQVGAFSRRLRESSEPSERVIHESFRISDRFLGDLLELTPPASTGVSAVQWRKAVGAVRRDGRAFDSFYVKEYPKLIRSFKNSNPKPKVPPGTGVTAAILAQAFNSPEGRRYLRLQRRLGQRTQADSKTMERIGRKVGLLKTCGDIFAGQSQSPAKTPSVTSSARTRRFLREPRHADADGQVTTASGSVSTTSSAQGRSPASR